MRVDRQLRLEGETHAVPRARRFVAETLAETVTAELLRDAQLAISELVTNAILHADSDVSVRVRGGAGGVQLEVADESRILPLRPQPSAEAMTGRGLTLVEGLASSWGVDLTEHGKVVWCRLDPEPSETSASADGGGPERQHLPADDLLELWDDAADGASASSGPTYSVSVSDVPTDLLLAAEEHTDNLARELTLAAGGAEWQTAADVQAETAHLVETAIARFSAARKLVQAQAVAAAAHGEERVDLSLTLPAEAASAAEAYLAALDQADSHAKAARLLTLETPPAHRALRRWYVGAIVDQLQAAADGDPAPRLSTFEEHLLHEVEAVAAGRAAAESLASYLGHLQQLTAELTGTSDVDQIAEIVVGHAADAFGALFSALYLRSGSTLQLLRARGTVWEWENDWDSLPLDAALPVCEAARTGQPVVGRGSEELLQRFPDLRVQPLSDVSLVCAPLQVGNRNLGVVTLSFPLHHDVTVDSEVAFLVSLADACAQALDRSHALAEAQRTTTQLAFLAEASAELSSTLDFRTTLSNIANLMVPRLADWCAVQIVEDGRITNLAVAHANTDKVMFAKELQEKYPTDPDSLTGIPQVLRTGVAEIYPVITDEMLVASAQDDEHLRITRELQISSVMLVPLTGREGTFGAITMMHAESGRHYTDDDLVFATELANRAAQAVDQARRYDRQTGQLAAMTRVAETAQHAILAPVPGRMGPVTLAASYFSAAREALVGGDLYEVIPTHEGVRLLIGDVRGKGLDAVRLATVVLGFFRSAAVETSSLARLARRMDARLAPYLKDEDFVTVLLAEINATGDCRLVSCGHPPPLLVVGDSLTQIDCEPSPPLGLGAAPVASKFDLVPGQRMLLFTDGLMEARDVKGEFIDLFDIAEPLRRGSLGGALQRILARLRAVSGEDLNDDLALLAAEFSPPGD